MNFVSNDTFWTTVIYYLDFKDIYHLKLCNKNICQIINLMEVTYYKVDKPLYSKYGQDWVKLKKILVQYKSFIGIPTNDSKNQENYMLVIQCSHKDFADYYLKTKTEFGKKLFYKQMDYENEKINCGIFWLDFVDLKFIIHHKQLNSRDRIVRKNKMAEYIYININGFYLS